MGKAKPTDGYFTYIARCADDTLYSGWTRDPSRREQEHNAGRGAKYTRSRRPIQFIAVWRFESQREAMQWERFLKTLPREQKLRLIAKAPNG
jgi:putative endonuclease